MMTLEDATKIQEWIEENLYNDADVEIREDYSGRGMNGDGTTAFIVGDETGLFAIGMAAHALDIELGCLPKRLDSMGRGRLVIY